MDAATSFIWSFLIKSKEPLWLFLKKHGRQTTAPTYIRTDQGGKLAQSTTFRQVVAEHQYSLETTASDNSNQNNRDERPHCSMSNKMHCLLYSSNLGSEFWSDDLLYLAYIYNRTHHEAINKTPTRHGQGDNHLLNISKHLGHQ